MHRQVSQLVLQGILKPDAQGNLSLNVEDDHFEDAIGDLIKASKSKQSLAKPRDTSSLCFNNNYSSDEKAGDMEHDAGN